MKVNITQCTVDRKPFKRGEVIAWNGGLYLATDVDNVRIKTMVIYQGGGATPAGSDTFFSASEDLARVHTLTALTE